MYYSDAFPRRNGHDRRSGVRATLCMILGAASLYAVPAASAGDDPLQEAPTDWRTFVDWASDELRRRPPPVPVPRNPRRAEQRRPVLYLEELMGDAEVVGVWQSLQKSTRPLASLGPFRDDLPNQNLNVRERFDEKLGRARVLTIKGFHIKREDVGAVKIEIRAPFGRHFDLDWALGGRMRIPLPDNRAFWPLTISTDGFPNWIGPLTSIKIRTDGLGDGPIEIRTLEFLPKRDTFPETAAARSVTVNRERRPAIYAHPPADIRFPEITLPRRAVLQVGLAYLALRGRSEANGSSRQSDDRAEPMEFSVSVEHRHETTEVLKRALEPAERWIDVSADLSKWSGKKVSITLKTIGVDFDSVAVWGAPRIYEPDDQAPCFVFYLIDTLAAKHLDLYGYDRPTGPNLKTFAAEGVWFSRAFCNSPVTVSSVPDILYSMPAERHGIYAASMLSPDGLVSLGEAIRAAGFATALFSTNVNAGPRQRTDRGFDTFVDRISLAWKEVVDRSIPLEDVRYWLETHADRPKFLYIHTAEPHAPYAPPPEFADRFDPDYDGPITGAIGGSRDFFNAKTARDLAHVAALYDEEVLYADHGFGRFRELLRDLKLHDRATIFVTADHGEELYEHGHWGHGPCLDTEVLHIPLIAAGPLVAARGRNDTPVQLYDIMPTILDLLDIPTPYELTGMSLSPLLRAGPPADTRAFQTRPIVHSHHRSAALNYIQYAYIEDGRWKLTFARTGGPGQPDKSIPFFTLYDFQNGIYNVKDVLDDRRDIGRRLIGKLIAYSREQHPYDPGLGQQALELSPEQIRELQALGYLEHDEE